MTEAGGEGESSTKPLVRLAGASVAMWLAPLFVIYSETGAIFTDWLGEHLSIKNRYASKAVGAVLAVVLVQVYFVVAAMMERSSRKIKYVKSD